MVKIKVTNGHDAPILLKEGQSGLYREKATIQPGKFYYIDFLPEATYREYMCVVIPGNSMIVNLSSDDLSDIPEEIVIEMVKGKLDFVLKKKNGFNVAHVTSDANIERGTAAVGNLFSKPFKGLYHGVVSLFLGKSKDKTKVEAPQQQVEAQAPQQQAPAQAPQQQAPAEAKPPA